MRKCHRICMVCNEPYYGQGKYCCSVKCKNVYLTGKKLNFSDEHRKFLSESMTLKTKNKNLSEEHKHKIGVASKLRWQNKEYRENIHNARIGREVTQETRDKIKKGNTLGWKTEKKLVDNPDKIIAGIANTACNVKVRTPLVRSSRRSLLNKFCCNNSAKANPIIDTKLNRNHVI